MHALASLRDVEGVQGSFVLTDVGRLLGKDLPAVFHEEVFVETGPRIVRLCEALEHGGEALESLALRFADHKLHVRRWRGGLLCVFANAEANGPALKMALALVARRLADLEEHDDALRLAPPRTMPHGPMAERGASRSAALPASSKPGKAYRD